MRDCCSFLLTVTGCILFCMITPAADNPFAVLTLIAAPAVFTNASSVLALGTGNRLARVVDRARVLSKGLHAEPPEDKAMAEMWMRHVDRLGKRGELLVRAMSGVRACNLVVSNLPGPQQPFYLNGCQMLEAFPLVPLNPANQGLSVGILSYDGGVYFGLLGDAGLDPPLEIAAAALRQALAELG